ncbi:phage baseplate protein [Robbsia andropogonis]|uniref:phage baseplate protein n=1 Tax=Robbsia andropogonis TaxID=28092 RepID=UPI000465DA7D|nr:hypothetical protein [Robbsia andropogonis]
MSALGYIESGSQLGLSKALQLVSIKTKRGLYASDGSFSMVAHATIEEVHEDELEVTDKPVETGSVISDHAYARPSGLQLTLGWSNSPTAAGALAAAQQAAGLAGAVSGTALAVVAGVQLVTGAASTLSALSGGVTIVNQQYANLLSLYKARTLFTIYTGRRVYSNMIIKSLTLTTDEKTENSMLIRVGCREILMAQTQTVSVGSDASVMSSPEKTQAVQDSGVVTPVPTTTINVTALP